MRLDKVDLSSLKAIAHDEDGLKLIIEREDSIDLIEIPAPVQAYEGLQLLDRIIASTAAIEPRGESIAMLPVHSTMAAQLGYDEDRHILQIEFNNGSVYQYADIEPETWEDLHSSDSIGCFYNEEIKAQYRSQKIH
jgi:hypothetical protein